MADQCIVCLDALEVASLAVDLATFKSLEDPGGRGGGDTLSSQVVADSAASSTTTTTTNSADEGNPGQSNNETDVAVINACGHALHNCCLLEWAGKANSCPICRQTFNDVSVYDKVGGNLLKSYAVADKKQVAEFDPQAWAEENPEEEDLEAHPCPVCNSSGDEEVLLLCDGCDASYHTYCIGLDEIPDGSWFCMECAEELGGIGIARSRARYPIVSNSRRGRRNDFFPRTQATMRSVRRRARSDEWQGAWGEITGLIFDAINIDLDSHDGDDGLEEYRRSRQLREREQREYQRWQQRISIARRLGAQDVFSRNIPPSIINSSTAAQAPAPAQESREERRAWATLEKAREANGEGPSRKRKSRSITPSPAEPQPEPERKLKRPRAHRSAPGASGEGSSSTSEPSRSVANIRSPPALNGDAPSFLSVLLKEVEQSHPPDDEITRNLLPESMVGGDAYASSPGSSPPASAYSSPRALSLTPPPHQNQPSNRSTRPSSPTMTLSSTIEPVYTKAAYRSGRSSGNASDSETRPAKPELRQPRPQRVEKANLSRSPDVSPTKVPLPLEMKQKINNIVRGALKPHWASSKLTADQYETINRDVSRKLYDEVTDPASVIDADVRQMWQHKATQEVARAVSGLQA
ncbi:hypothetical protein PspLS_02158 [Pyricularia sp. CBS 133598]|nr:hypothetical protein PspLS_02158 [Pyricularia sp. CBS 133598]